MAGKFITSFNEGLDLVRTRLGASRSRRLLGPAEDAAAAVVVEDGVGGDEKSGNRLPFPDSAARKMVRAGFRGAASVVWGAVIGNSFVDPAVGRGDKRGLIIGVRFKNMDDDCFKLVGGGTAAAGARGMVNDPVDDGEGRISDRELLMVEVVGS